MAKKSISPPTEDCPCKFLGVTTDGHDVKIRINLDDQAIPVGSVKRNLVGAKLEAEVILSADAKEDAKGQKAFIPDKSRVTLSGAEVRNVTIRCKPAGYGLTVVCQPTKAEREELFEYSGKGGRFLFTRSGDVEAEEEKPEKKDAKGQLKLSDAADTGT